MSGHVGHSGGFAYIRSYSKLNKRVFLCKYLFPFKTLKKKKKTNYIVIKVKLSACCPLKGHTY